MLRKRSVVVASRYLRDRGCHRIVFKVFEDSGDKHPPRTRYSQGKILDGDMARLLIELVEEAALDGVQTLVVRMETNHLSKNLLQRSRSIRSPALFEVIRELHGLIANAGVHVIVGGPASMPPSVRQRLEGHTV